MIEDIVFNVILPSVALSGTMILVCVLAFMVVLAFAILAQIFSFGKMIYEESKKRQ